MKESRQEYQLALRSMYHKQLRHEWERLERIEAIHVMWRRQFLDLGMIDDARFAEDHADILHKWSIRALACESTYFSERKYPFVRTEGKSESFRPEHDQETERAFVGQEKNEWNE